MAVTEKNIKAQQETYDLNHSRYEAGIISELPVKQALYNLERSRSQIPTLQAGLAAAKNRLAVLLGETPGVLDEELKEEKPIPIPPASVAVGVPAETLRHRPDIRRAERNLAAQTARIGVATADLYPKFRLFGSIGLESFSNDVFLDYSNRTWRYGPGASWNIFDAGAIRQNIKVQTARQEQALNLPCVCPMSKLVVIHPNSSIVRMKSNHSSQTNTRKHRKQSYRAPFCWRKII